MDDFGSDVSPDNFEVLLTSSQCFNLLCSSNSTRSQFWMQYIKCFEIRLSLIRISRERDWPLHFASISDMIKWYFAYDPTNCARYLPWYLNNMISLSTSHLQPGSKRVS